VALRHHFPDLRRIVYDCEECGSETVSGVILEGVSVEECDLCGNLSGDDRNVAHVLLVREARATGVHPSIYPLVLQLNKIGGLRVLRADVGDIALKTWPYVQMAMSEGHQATLESLTKSLGLTNTGSEVHWVLELEYQMQLVLTLKPRFHRDLDHIHDDLLELTRADLDRVRRNLGRDMFLSWWRS
jgi:hypothetical protein